MLKNELTAVKALIDTVTAATSDHLPDSLPAVGDTFLRVTEAWEQAVFSRADDVSLKRFFSYHLEGVRELLDTLRFSGLKDDPVLRLKAELLKLIACQRQYFGNYFDSRSVAPSAFCEQFSAERKDLSTRIIAAVSNATIDIPLKNCLLAYFKKADFSTAAVKYTYRALFYFETLLHGLDAVFFGEPMPDLNKALAAKLTELNFNALDFFSYKKKLVEALVQHLPLDTQVRMLFNELEALKLLPEPPGIYDDRLPPLADMQRYWLSEEISRVKKMISLSQQSPSRLATAKLSLNLSVAQLACLTRLFFEENIFNSATLTAIFKFMSGCFQTKRQRYISPGSFSKEYYSVSQVTAAVVRDKLLKIVARINREYFPVMAVTGAAILVHSALH